MYDPGFVYVDNNAGGNFFTRHVNAILITLVLLVLAGAAGFGAMYYMKNKPAQVAVSTDTLPKGVTIAGINVGGMSKSSAVSTLSLSLGSDFTKKDMVLVVGEDRVVLSPEDTGASVDVAGAVEEAMAYKADEAENTVGMHNISLLPYLTVNKEFIRNAIAEQTQVNGTVYQPASYVLEGNAPALDNANFNPDAPTQILVLNTGCAGYNFDADSLVQMVMDGYANGTFFVDASQNAELMTPEALDLEQIYKEVSVLPSSKTHEYDFDMEYATTLLRGAHSGDVIRVPMRFDRQASTGANADFPDILGAGQTLLVNSPNRNSNIKLVCEKLDSFIIHPGEEFSFLKAIGDVTTENGFVKAKPCTGYEDNEILGGGICQAATTLYYCAMLSDLEITDHTNHKVHMQYIDNGMDAEITAPGVDLKFRNTTENDIMIQAGCAEGYLKIKLLGVDTKDYYIKMSYILDVIEVNTVYQYVGDNKNYNDGDIIDIGRAGANVITYRCKYSKVNDELISRDVENKCVYPAGNRIIAKRAPEVEPTNPTTPTVPSTPTEPVTPTDPTTPTTPTDPTVPSEEPTEPTTPSEEPTEPTTPSEEPTEPTTPSEEPTDPSEEPTNPGSGETEAPSDSGEVTPGSGDTGSDNGGDSAPESQPEWPPLEGVDHVN